MSVKIPISAEFDSGDLDKVIQQFTTQMNRLAKSIAQANNTQFSPIGESTVDDIKKVTQQFEALKRLSESFNRRLKDTGQDKLNLFDVDFHKLYENQRAGARKALDVLQYVTAGTSMASRMPVPSSAVTHQSQPHGGSPATVGWKHWGGNVFNSAMGAAGPGGQVISNAVSTGMSSGLKAGLFGLAGGFAALGVGKLISSAREKIGDAQQESIGYDHLKRSLGDVNIGFDGLKDSLRFASDNIWETYGKTQELAVEFAKVSGITREQAKNISGEIQAGGAFSWSFGLDTKQGNQFFAQMRQHKVTNSEADTRRMALMLGEGIARSGAFSKADELMQAIAGYTANQARSGMTAPNVEGYMGMLAGMVKSGIPGLDPHGASALLGRVNASIASGGGAGEAGQNFIYAQLGRSLGLDPIQTKLLQEGGAFASGSSVFGSELYRNYAKKNNMAMPFAAGSNATNLEMLMSGLDSQYSHNPALKLDAMSNLFGVNISQAMALDQIDRHSLGGMQERLNRAGIDIKDVASSGISTLSNIHGGDANVLNGVITGLRGRTDEHKLKAGERDRLDKAISNARMTGDNEELRQVLFELSATREMQHTEGSKTQQLLIETNNRLTDVASTLVVPLNEMKDGILYLAKKAGFDSETKEKDRVIDGWMSQIKAGLQASGASADSGGALLDTSPVNAMRSMLSVTNASPGSSSVPMDMSDGVAMSAASRKRMNDILNSLPKEEADRYRSDPAFMAVIDRESGWQHYGKDGGLLRSKAGALGFGQIMPATARNPGFGVKPLQNDSPRENLRFSYDYWSALLKRYDGDHELAAAAYNAGVGNVDKRGKNWGLYEDETRAYVPAITAAAGMTDLPEGHERRMAKNSHDARIMNETSITLQYPDGKPAAQPVHMQTMVSLPMPFGGGR